MPVRCASAQTAVQGCILQLPAYRIRFGVGLGNLALRLDGLMKDKILSSSQAIARSGINRNKINPATLNINLFLVMQILIFVILKLYFCIKPNHRIRYLLY